MLVEVCSFVRWAGRSIKIKDVAMPPHDVPFDFQQTEILVEGCASDCGPFFGIRRG